MIATFWTDENVNEWLCKKKELDDMDCKEAKMYHSLGNEEKEKMVKNGGKFIKVNEDENDYTARMVYRKPEKVVDSIKKALE